MGEVEAGHHERAAVAEHGRGRFGVGPDVELGDRRAVAERAPAHHGDAGDAPGQVGGEAEREGDVGERADGDDPHALAPAAGLDDELDGVAAVEGPRRRGQVGAVEPALAVDHRRRSRLGQQRSLGAGVNGDVDAQELAHDQRVVGRAVERRVAGHGGDAEQLAVPGRDDDGDRVVVTRVAVEDHRHHDLTLSSLNARRRRAPTTDSRQDARHGGSPGCKLEGTSSVPRGWLMRTVNAGVPDLVPILSRGKHRNPRKGACFMELASYLAGERWSDHPRCTHPLLASVARLVNDLTSDAHRSRLAGLIPCVIGMTSDDPRIDAADRPAVRQGGAADRRRRGPERDGRGRARRRAGVGRHGGPARRAPSRTRVAPRWRRRRSPPSGRGRSGAATTTCPSSSSVASPRRTSCASPCRRSPRRA